MVSHSLSRVTKVQIAALPWRLSEGAIEVLLITTRNTRRWIVPKGWPIKGCTPSESAAREALEEAGVLGEISAEALGSFRYDKERQSGGVVPCTVHVFAMKVIEQRQDWPEKSERTTRWCTLDQALELVTDPGLRRLIAKFEKASSTIVNAA